MENINLNAGEEYQKAEERIYKKRREAAAEKAAKIALRKKLEEEIRQKEEISTAKRPDFDKDEYDHDLFAGVRKQGEMSEEIDEDDEDDYDLPTHISVQESFGNTESEGIRDATESLTRTERRANRVMWRLMTDELRHANKVYFYTTAILNAFRLEDRIKTQKILRENPLATSTRENDTDFCAQRIAEAKANLATLQYLSPEAFITVNGRKLKEYRKQLDRHELVTTPYVERQLERVRSNMDIGKNVFVHGHLGGGKTELLITAAVESSIERMALRKLKPRMEQYYHDNPNASEEEYRNERARLFTKYQNQFRNAYANGDKDAKEMFMPLMISGSSDLTTKDLFVEKTLKLATPNDKSIKEREEELAKEFDRWIRDNPEDAKDPAKKQAKSEELLELYKINNSAYGTVVENAKKEILRAAEEGRPVIIDEVNAIPPSVLISLNDILNRKPGETCYIPGVGRVKIHRGFSILMTGNMSSSIQNYIGTYDVNNATLSRVATISYDYLPMSDTDTDYTNQSEPEKNELFHVVMSYLIDRNLNLEIPDAKRNLQKIFELCVFAHRTQLVYTGRWKKGNINMKDHSGRDITPRLEKAVLSIRNVLDVIRKWNKGKEMDLDWALWEGFISGQPNPDDKNLLIKMAHDCGFFQESDGYNPIIAKGYGDGETTEEELRDMNNSYYYYPDKKELIDMPEVIEAVYGEIPDRRVWPRADMLNEYDDEVPEEDYKRCDEMRESVKKSVQLLEVLAEQCGCDKEEA